MAHIVDLLGREEDLESEAKEIVKGKGVLHAYQRVSSFVRLRMSATR